MSLKRILLLIRDVPKTTKFYNEGLGLPVIHASDTWAELSTNGGTSICLSHTEGEAALTTGYSPLLSFNVEDLDETVNKMLALDATLDGAIRYEDSGRVAALRSPEGQMLTIFEPNN